MFTNHKMFVINIYQLCHVIIHTYYFSFQYNIDFHNLTSQSQNISPYQSEFEEFMFERPASSTATPKETNQSSSKPNI